MDPIRHITTTPENRAVLHIALTQCENLFGDLEVIIANGFSKTDASNATILAIGLIAERALLEYQPDERVVVINKIVKMLNETCLCRRPVQYEKIIRVLDAMPTLEEQLLAEAFS